MRKPTGSGSYRLEFELPGLPPMTNPKSGGSRNWRALWRMNRRWKRDVILLVQPKRPPAPLERAKLTLIRASSVAPDSDGLVSGFKAVIDGLREARVIANDRYQNIGMPDYRWEPATQGKGFIRVIVEGIE